MDDLTQRITAALDALLTLTEGQTANGLTFRPVSHGDDLLEVVVEGAGVPALVVLRVEVTA